MAKPYELKGFDEFIFDHDGLKKTVFRTGKLGDPPILLMQELPGMTKHTLDLALRLATDGFVVYLPLLFGRPGGSIEVFKNAIRLCLQREFHFLAWHKSSPIADWLRLLCRYISDENNGRSVGAIGMCFTGRFVLSLLVEDVLVAPVMAQPGHPKGHGSAKAAATLGVPECDLLAAKKRVSSDGVRILGLRFENDPFCPPQRFETMEKEFGDNFVRFDIDHSLYENHKIRDKAHAVLTIDYSNERGHPTRLAYQKMVGFLRERLV